VSIANFDPTRTQAQWDSLLSLADVVLVGGDENIDTLEGNIAYERLSNYYLNGANVVSTGGVVEQFFDIPTGATDVFLDTITPIGSQTGGTSTGTNITIVSSQASHPIVNDIPISVTNLGSWYTAGTGQTDAGSLALANPTGGGSGHALSIQTVPVAGAGNSVFIGGAYLNHTITSSQSADLRSGSADHLLEQALAWAAGVDKVNENTLQTFTADRLLANDVNATVSATITETSGYSTLGATIRLIGGDVFYDPSTSDDLNNIGEGMSVTDTFSYTVSDGGQTSSATVTVLVPGVTETNLDPQLSGSELNGFSAQNSNAYRYGPTIYQDTDESAGVQYVIYRNGNPGDPPTGVTFDPTFATLTFTLTAQTNYLEDMSLYAYEPDGQNASVSIGYSVDAAGDLRFVFTNFAQADGGPVLEIAFDDNFGAGDVAGTGELVDLSGIETLAPTVLDTLAVLDLRNGQENLVTIDTAALLEMISGNASAATENFKLQMDSYDNYILLDDSVSGADWSADLASGTTYNLTDTTAGTAGDPGSFGVIGEIFATLEIDGGVQGFPPG
jgi:hypothetical protein